MYIYVFAGSTPFRFIVSFIYLFIADACSAVSSFMNTFFFFPVGCLSRTSYETLRSQTSCIQGLMTGCLNQPCTARGPGERCWLEGGGGPVSMLAGVHKLKVMRAYNIFYLHNQHASPQKNVNHFDCCKDWELHSFCDDFNQLHITTLNIFGRKLVHIMGLHEEGNYTCFYFKI